MTFMFITRMSLLYDFFITENICKVQFEFRVKRVFI
jgi:hypothetical protein